MDNIEMNIDLKAMALLLFCLIVVPMVMFGINEFHKQSCKIELSKAGRSVDEIRELCK